MCPLPPQPFWGTNRLVQWWPKHKLSPALASGLLIGGVLLAICADYLPACSTAPNTPLRFSELLPSASVTATVKGEELPLTPAGPALANSRLPAWNWVGVRRISMPRPKKSEWHFLEASKPGRITETCLWVHPVNDGHLRLDFPNVELGGEVRGFFHALRSASPKMKVKVALILEGETIAKLSPKLKPGGLWEFQEELPGSGTGTLSLLIKQRSRGKNHLCFDGVISGP